MVDQLLTQTQVCRFIQACPKTLKKAIAAGTLPPPIYLTPGQPRWPQKALEDAVEAACRRAGHADEEQA